MHLSLPRRHAESLLYSFFVRFFFAWNFCKLSGKAKTQIAVTEARRVVETASSTAVRRKITQTATTKHTVFP
jgi:hypothetical protein